MPNFNESLLLLAELQPYKYAGYPQLIKTIKLETADEQLFSKSAPLLSAASELAYHTVHCSALNVEELRRENGLEVCNFVIYSKDTQNIIFIGVAGRIHKMCKRDQQFHKTKRNVCSSLRAHYQVLHSSSSIPSMPRKTYRNAATRQRLMPHTLFQSKKLYHF